MAFGEPGLRVGDHIPMGDPKEEKDSKDPLVARLEEKAIAYDKKLKDEDSEDRLQLILSPDDFDRVTAAQKERWALIRELQEALDDIDNPPSALYEKPRGGPTVTYESNQLFVETRRERKPITKGQLFSSIIWGLEFSLDASVPDEIRKAYVKRLFLSKIKRFTDEQELIEAIVTEGDPGRKEAYEASLESLFVPLREQPAGRIAEKLTMAVIMEAAIDGELDFSIEEVPLASGDVDKKIDFVIKKHARTRGVKTVGAEEDVAESYGVQFTTDMSEETEERKLGQIETVIATFGDELDVNDIVLVRLGLKSVRNLYREWLHDNRPPSGPHQYWDPEMQKEVFKGVLEKMYSGVELDEMWKKAHPEAGDQVITEEVKGPDDGLTPEERYREKKERRAKKQAERARKQAKRAKEKAEAAAAGFTEQPKRKKKRRKKKKRR